MYSKWLVGRSHSTPLTVVISNLISLDFETSVVANLEKELAEVGGHSAGAKKQGKKRQVQSTESDEAELFDGLDLPPVDNGSDDDYIDVDDPEASEVVLLPFTEVREGILKHFKALLRKSFFEKPFVLRH